MKPIAFLSTLCLICFIACEDANEEPVPDVEVNQEEIEGNWRVSRFIDDGEDETDDLSPFIFQFQADGTLIIDRNDEAITASYSLSNDGQTLFFQIPDETTDQVDPEDELEELDDDPWTFVTFTENLMELIEQDDDDDDLAELTFTRL